MFVGALPEGYTPRSIVFVGDDGRGTLAQLAAKTYPEMKINIVDRSPVRIMWLESKAEKNGWSTFTGDITDPDTIADIVNKTSGGTDAVFMKHGVHLNHPRNQEKVVACLFRLSRPGGSVGWLVRLQEDFTDVSVDQNGLHSTVYVGRNTPERQLKAEKITL